jgi:hypothetical protein
MKGSTWIGGVKYVTSPLPNKRSQGKPAVCPICRRRIRSSTPHTGNAQRGHHFRRLHAPCAE